MLKVFHVNKTALVDAVDYLKENLGTEGVRWWTEGRERPTIYYNDGTGPVGGGYIIALDVTDEEEPIVTAFALRFVQ